MAEAFPLSPQQRRLWTLAGGPPAACQATLLLRGAVEAGRLRSALEVVAADHEILRTRFERLEWMKVPQQVIDEVPAVRWRQVDLAGAPGSEREALWLELVTQEAAALDPLAGPPLSAVLVAWGEAEWRLLVTTSELCADRWSLGLLARGIARAYDDGGGDGTAGEEPLQYVDYSDWLLDKQEGVDERERDHWQAFWAAWSAGSEVEGQDSAGDRERSLLPASTVAAVDRLAGELETTPATVLHAAWTVLLFRLAGNRVIAVARVRDGRPYDELRDGIGPYACPLPSPVEPCLREPFGDLVRRLAGVEGEDADLQLLEIPEEARFPHLFEYAEAPPPWAVRGVEIRLLERSWRGEPTRLGLTAERRGTGLDGGFLAAAVIHLEIARGNAHRLAELACGERLSVLLSAALERPQTAVGRLPVLGREERRLQIEGYVTAAARQAEPVHRRIVAAARRHPERPAVVGEGRTLTYGELDRRSAVVARRLRRLGVGPEVRVALHAGRSPEALVALLAVLRAGGAYVPLDAAYPAPRLVAILEDAAPRVVLATPELARDLPPESVRDGVELLLLDDTLTGPLEENGADGVDGHPAEERLAYVIFTSGSTGRPKGVAVEHRQLAGYVDSILALLDVPATAVWATVSTLAADLGHTMVFPALATGGTLHLVPPEVAAEGAAMARYCADHGVDCLKIVPSHLEALLASSAEGPPLPGKCLVIGGEAASPELLGRLADTVSDGRRTLNHYGPTETTVGVLAGAFDASAATFPLPLGRPLAGVRVYVVDSGGMPVPAGVPGEVWVAGRQVARGYLGRPRETAERFRPDRFAGTPGERLYRTGDMALFDAAGELRYHGRNDHQVKLRGFRIELGEVEAALEECPGVARAVAVLRRDGAGARQRLVAYVVSRSGTDGVGGSALSEAVAGRLPDYQVPSAWVVLDQLPLTPNGKVDRSALPEPEPRDADARRPRGMTEQMVAAVFADLLAVERVGADDGFFTLGGHSLLATRLISRLRAAFEVELPLAVLFDAPTVSGVASAVESLLRQDRELAAPPIEPRPDGDDDLPLSFAQERLWFLARLEPDNSAYNVPVALRLEGALDVAALRGAFSALVRRHEILRTRYREHDGRPVQRVEPAVGQRLPLVDLSALSAERGEAELRKQTRAEARTPFDLAAAPPLRLRLVRLAEADHALLVTLHHIASDGWSRGILSAETATLYTALDAGRPSPLEPLPVQYADFAVWQRNWLSGEVLARQLTYWKLQLEGLPPRLELPTDRPRRRLRDPRGAAFSFELPGELMAAVRRRRGDGTTPFMLLLAVFGALMGRYSGQRDFAVGTPVAGRNRLEIEGLIGFFVNTLVLRLDLAGGPSLDTLVERVRRTALGAYTHQDLPFEKLVEELEPDRDLASSPFFQVSFAVEEGDAEPAADGAAELRLREMPQATETAKFDLGVGVRVSGDRMGASLEYRRELFDAATIERLGRHFEALLRASLEAPTTPLDELLLLTGAELRQVVEEWGSRRGRPLEEMAIHRRVLRHAVSRPDAEALVAGDQRFTYARLDALSGALAARLVAAGVGPEVPVAIWGERGAELVVSMLAVLRAGGFFLTLDPALPAARLSWLLGDVAAHRLLAPATAAVRLPPGAEPMLVDLAADGGGALRPNPDVDGLASADQAAVAIYTSGSTGVPKGIVLSHRNLTHHLACCELELGFGSRQRLLQFCAPSFDASVEEILGSLASGGALVLRRDEDMVSADALWRRCRDEGISILDLPTAFWHELARQVETEAASPPACLQRILLGGEEMSAEALAAWRRAVDGIELVNLYGPAEATVAVTAWHAGRYPRTAAPTLGGPLGDARVHVVDRSLRPVPPGVIGELVAGGVRVSRGYLGRPRLTADAFVPDPFSTVPGARLYRSGDLGRWRNDGQLLFHGRGDAQVKVRGYRVELGEIEAELRRRPGVKEAAVVLQDAGGATARLVAFVALTDDSVSPDGAEAVRQDLERTLPAYMVPTAFRVLPELPIGPTGKVDRRTLLQMPVSGAAEAAPTGGTPPCGAGEEVVAGIWCELLGLDTVAADAGFFDLGGHSLLAVRMLARLREVFRLEIPPRQVFETPTIGGLVDVLAGLLGGREMVDEFAGTYRRVQELSDDEVEELLSQGSAGPGARA